MKLQQIVAALELEVVSGANLDREIEGGYASDLLSNVMAKAVGGQLWVTHQGHQNIIAVAVLVELAGIIVVDGVKIDAETSEKAKAEGINLFTTPLPGFEVAGRLYALGLRGKQNV
jgi:hypothetical protein